MFEGKEVKVLLSVAGSGKTRRLIEEVTKELEKRRPEEIAFVTFTRKGADEGLRRVCSKLMYEPDDLPYFRTIHSLTFHAMNYKANQMFGRIDQRKFNKEYGYNVNRVEVDKSKATPTKDTMYLDFYDLERSDALTSKQLVEADIELGYYHQLVRNYEEYKSQNHLVDFFDCLLQYVQAGESLPVKVALIDECFSPDTEVRMADMSVKKIKDIKVGDIVMGTRGSTVVTRTCSGSDEMYDIHSKNQNILLFTCNSKHLIEVNEKNNWKRASSIKDGAIVFVNEKETECYINKSYYGEYVGITVGADDSCFVLANGCVVHNCQDLTALQWRVVEKAFSRAEKIVLAGDESQSIFTYSGARPDFLIQLSKQFPVENLARSYRIPKSVYRLAKSITDFIGDKTDKPFLPREENIEGSVTQLTDIERLANFIDEDSYKCDRPEAQWYILSRNNCYLDSPARMLEENLIPYWTTDGFFMGGEIMKRLKDYEGFRLSGYKDEAKREQFQRKFGIADFNEDFTNTNLFTEGRKWVYAAYIEKYGLQKLSEMCKWNPQILVSTVHQVKGGECKNCAVLLDATRRTRANVFNDIDEELRILYVAVTRAKENLYLIDSKNGDGYDNIISTVKIQNGLEW